MWFNGFIFEAYILCWNRARCRTVHAVWPKITISEFEINRYRIPDLSEYTINIGFSHLLYIIGTTNCTPPNYCAYTPNYYTHTPPLRSFHLKLEYYVYLAYLYLNHENNTTRPYQEPAIIECRRGYPDSSINRINSFT